MPINSITSIEYRAISEFPGYRVGNDGSVWSNRTHVGGTRWLVGLAWKRLRPGRARSGHLYVYLRRGNKTHQRPVHALVLEEFVGPCPPDMECRHFPDQDPANNRLDNLQWGTPGENIADKVFHATDNRGERNSLAKLTEADVRLIRAAVAAGEMQKTLARRFGVSTALVSVVVNNKAWKHVT